MRRRTETARRRPRAVRPAPKSPVSATAEARHAFSIVGIGASAGGLEALELFFANVPEGCGIAFVVVQHLDPTHKALMPELLQRVTAMKVMQAKDRTRVKPGCVYVIPPNKDMSILHEVLHLLDPITPRGLRLPIDFFFRSLAHDRQEKSIGVILSGMGTDGTHGAKAMKEKAGVVFVQEPATAKFDGMPSSVIMAGLADVVAPAEALPGKIIAYLRHAPMITKPGVAAEDKSHSSFEKIVILLRAQTGHDFSLYKKSTIYRRIERRMSIHQIDRIAKYVRYLQENSQEVELLFRELLIGVTGFFRDPTSWEQLKDKALPALLAAREPGQTLRAWVPGCATGEEAYSLAIVFHEAMDQLNPKRNITLQIFATDLARDAIEKARGGAYPANIAADMSSERLKRFFVEIPRGYQICKLIREMVIFAPQNIIMDPPFTKVDILSCRNLLIYLAPELQKKLLPLFHYSLNPGGILFLGSSETIGGFADLFVTMDDKARLYRQIESSLRADTMKFPAAFAVSIKDMKSRESKRPGNIQSLADHLLLQTYSPAAVLVNDKGDILYISGRTGKYLEPAAGKANLNIFAMAREGLHLRLPGALQRAIRKGGAVTLHNVIVSTDGGTQAVDVTLHALVEPEELRGMVMIVFRDVAMPVEAKPASKTGRASAHGSQVVELERELERMRHELQAAQEEMQTSQEEQRSANEELQSTNEELQSTNEELVTSEEEMQSINEELQTINSELQIKVDELSQLNNDMKNLLDSTDITTLFLDCALRVRLFTTRANRAFRLIPSDVGRSITDITSELLYPELEEDAREVLRTLVSRDREVTARNGDWFMVRIMPYRTFENMIDGVVITFSDISAFKSLEAELRKAQVRSEEHIREQDVMLAQSEADLKAEIQRGQSEKGS